MHAAGPKLEVMGIALLTPHHGSLIVAADDVHDVFKPDLRGHTVHGWATVVAVSYTHLTLPTICSV